MVHKCMGTIASWWNRDSTFRPEVFISATSADLAKARETTTKALLDAGCFPVVQEHFTLSAGNIQEREAKAVQDCHAVIHIAGIVYGMEPNPPLDPRRSYTQLEYDAAKRHHKPVYLFIPTPQFYATPSNLPPEYVDSEEDDKKRLQKAHLTKLRQGNDNWYEFSSLEELRVKVKAIRLKRTGFSKTALIIFLVIAVCAGLLYWKSEFEGNKTRELLVDLLKNPNKLLSKAAEEKGVSVEKVAKDLIDFKTRVDSDPEATSEDKKLSEVAGKFVMAGFTPEQFKIYVKELQFNTWKPSFIVLHHTASSLQNWEKNPEGGLRGFKQFFSENLKWTGGYHLLIDKDKIWVFNRLTEPGIHAMQWNKISLGVAMVGDYENEPLSDGVRNTTVAAIAILNEKLGLKAEELRFHGELPGHRSNCPGKNVSKEDFIQRISNAQRP